jgi:hypothetical protein
MNRADNSDSIGSLRIRARSIPAAAQHGQRAETAEQGGGGLGHDREPGV